MTKIYIVVSTYNSPEYNNSVTIEGIFKNKYNAICCIKDVVDYYKDNNKLHLNKHIMNEEYNMPEYLYYCDNYKYHEYTLEIKIQEEELK